MDSNHILRGVIEEGGSSNDYEAQRNYQVALKHKGLSSFCAEISEISPILDLLKPLSLEKKDRVVCAIRPEGLEFIKDLAGVMQFKVFLKVELFQDYSLMLGDEELPQVHFGVNLDQFVKGLDFLKSNQLDKAKHQNFVDPQTVAPQVLNLFMLYDESLGTFKLSMASVGVITQTNLFIYDTPMPIPYFLFETDTMASTNFKAHFLKEALINIDPEAEMITFKISHNYPNFVIYSKGPSWEYECALPNNTNVVESMKCPIGTDLIGCYRYSHIIETLPVLSSSDNIKLCINDLGFISINFHIVLDHFDEACTFCILPIIHQNDLAISS